MVKSENIKKVIDTLKSVLPLAKHDYNLSMFTPHVNKGYICGTVHCHAGWYSIAKAGLDGEERDFFHGIQEIRKDLGLEYNVLVPGILSDVNAIQFEFKDPAIWGNRFTHSMFNDAIAFYHPTKRPDGARNLQDIVDHWQEVYERVRALEQPEYKDITSELANKPVTEEVCDMVVVHEIA